MARLRYFDGERQRPGLPRDVAALVDQLSAKRTRLHLVNLSPFYVRDVVVQAGAFGEHRFTAVRYERRVSEYPSASATRASICTHHNF